MNILETKNLSVNFSGFKALTNVNFQLKKGELRVILGPNGAGKTTFMDLITGKSKATNGQIFFKDKNITNLSSSKIAGMGIGRKFQGPNIFDNMTINENIEVALSGFNNIFKSFKLKKDNTNKEKVINILNEIGLYEKRNDYAYILSHGQKQWLEMGMLLAQQPELIILDEPTTGMTASETYKTGELIETIFKDCSVIVVEHDMDFVRQIAKNVTVLHQGMVLAEGTLSEVENNEMVQKVYLKEETYA